MPPPTAKAIQVHQAMLSPGGTAQKPRIAIPANVAVTVVSQRHRVSTAGPPAPNRASGGI
jgi:hypothetical protein